MATKLSKAEYEQLKNSEKPEDIAFLRMAESRGMIPDMTRGRGATSEFDYETELKSFVKAAENKTKIEINIAALMDRKAPPSALAASYWSMDSGPGKIAEELGYRCSIKFVRATTVSDATSKDLARWGAYFRPVLVLTALTDADRMERARKREKKAKKLLAGLPRSGAVKPDDAEPNRDDASEE